MEKIKLTPKEFLQLLNETSLKDEQKTMVIDLIQQLSVNQVNQIIDLLVQDAKSMQKILTRMEAAQEQTLLNFEIEVQKIKQQK